MKTYTLDQIYAAAFSLIETGAPSQTVDIEASEYARGVCELIGRLRLDFGGEGEGTGENAVEAAAHLNARFNARRG